MLDLDRPTQPRARGGNYKTIKKIQKKKKNRNLTFNTIMKENYQILIHIMHFILINVCFLSLKLKSQGN